MQHTCTCTYPVVSDRWGATDVATLSPQFILLSASLTAWQNFNPVHSAMLFSRRFFCRPLLLPPCTVPCKIVLASPDDLDTCPNHFNLRFFTVVKISSQGPMACLILTLTASLVMWSLYEMPSSFRKHLISVAYNLYTQPQSCILYPTWSRRTANPEEKYRFCFFVFPLYYISAVIG